MNYYPVIIPTLNRFQHFKECVESLTSCTHADKTELIIGLDYPPSEKYIDGWKQIKEYIPTIYGFYKVTLFEHKRNLGAFGNIDFLTNYVTEHYDAYIFTEDDNVFSPCFLDYMDKCLEHYKDIEEVTYVCGCFEHELSKLLQSELNIGNYVIKVIGNLNAYGLGIWRDKEKKIVEEFPTDFRKYVFNSRRRLIKLLKCPSKLNHIYFWIRKKPELNRLCEFTRNAWMVLKDQVNILPVISLVRNNGFDGTGENCGYSAQEIKIWNEMKTSNESTYTINDNITTEDVKRASNKLFKSAPRREKKAVIPIVFIYFVFGYRISEFLVRLYESFKSQWGNK